MTAPRDDDVDLAALAVWLESTGLPHHITAAERLGGGTQNIVLGLTIDGRDVVLRHPPAHPRPHSNRAIAREMRVLRALRHTTVPHPTLIAGSSDPEALGGATFYLMEAVAGANPAERAPAAYVGRPDWVAQACTSIVGSLAALGSVPPDQVGLGDLDRSDGFLERQIARAVSLRDGMTDTPGYDPKELGEIDTVVDWLRGHMPVPGPPGIVHGDFQLNNVMVADDHPALAAIIDWEMCTVGDPLLDLGWLLLCWPGEDPTPLRSGAELAAIGGVPGREEMIDVYRRHTTRDLSAIDWYVALAALKLGILLETTYVRSLGGQAPRETGDRLHALAIDLLATGRDIAAGRWSPAG